MTEGPFVLGVIHSLVSMYNITLQSYETINKNSFS